MAKRTALQLSILKLMEDEKLDALASPAMRRKPAPLGEPQGGSGCQLSASTSFPAITVPAGFTADGLPVGLELLGRGLDDAKLVSYAYAYEQGTRHRRAPLRTPALGGRTSLPFLTWKSSARAAGTNSAIVAAFTLDPATNELAWEITATEFAEGEILAATLHRAAKDGNGPVIAVVANRAFEKLAGREILSDPDRERLMAADSTCGFQHDLTVRIICGFH